MSQTLEELEGNLLIIKRSGGKFECKTDYKVFLDEVVEQKNQKLTPKKDQLW